MSGDLEKGLSMPRSSDPGWKVLGEFRVGLMRLENTVSRCLLKCCTAAWKGGLKCCGVQRYSTYANGGWDEHIQETSYECKMKKQCNLDRWAGGGTMWLIFLSCVSGASIEPAQSTLVQGRSEIMALGEALHDCKSKQGKRLK